MTTPAKRAERHRPAAIDFRDDHGHPQDATRAPRLVQCAACGFKAMTYLPAPDGWEDGLCRRCVVLSGLLR